MRCLFFKTFCEVNNEIDTATFVVLSSSLISAHNAYGEVITLIL